MTALTNQKAFDQVAVHLLTQNWKSTEEVYYPESTAFPEYRYRGHLNAGVQLKCAIGCLIPDELYRPEMEGTNFRELRIKYPKLAELFKDIDGSFAMRLQHMHDNFEAYQWKSALRQIANEFKLSPAILDRFPYF